MAQLKDLIVNGATRLIGDVFTNKIELTSISAPTSSGGTTYGLGSNGQVLKSNGSSIYWANDNNSVTGVKGNSESAYRTGQVNITAANIGLGNVENKSSATIRGELTSSNVTTALGYTPYNSTNPNGYTTNTGTVTSIQVQASDPLQSSTNTAQSATLNTTISLKNQNANKILAGPSSGSAAAPTFRSLVAADIPNLSWNKITSDKPTTLSGYGITDAKIASGVITLGSNTITPLTSSSTLNAAKLSGTIPTSCYTNTWNALSTSQAGYVAQAPNDTTKFLRGDATWSDEISGGLFKVTNNGNTLSIGSKNTNYTHFESSADRPFYFNKTIYLSGDVIPAGDSNTKNLGSSDKKWQKVYIGTNDSYGTTTQPIYWNAGVPTAITYTANRLYYPSTTTAFTAGTHYVSDTKIAINSTSIPSQTLYVEGQTKINNTTASSTTNESGTLIVSNSNSENVALELWRNANASWQLANESGVLYLRNNYTTSKQSTYSQNGLTMDYNTSNASFAGKLSIGQTVRNTDYQLYVNSSVAKSIYLNTSHATASGKWNSIIQGYAPNMATGSNTSIGGGQAASEYNSGFLQFHYTGSGSTSNYIGFGLNGHDYLIRCYGTGNFSIGADNNNYKLYVNGTSYHNGNDTHAGNIEPSADSTYSIGSALFHWQHGCYDDLFVSTNTGYIAANSTVAGTKIGTGQIDLTNTNPVINLHRDNKAAISGSITGDTTYGLTLSGVASRTGAPVSITGTVGSTGITYNGRTIKPMLFVNGITYATDDIETSGFFMSNSTGTSSANNGFFLYRDQEKYAKLYVNQNGTAAEGDGEGTPYTNTVGETILELGNGRQGTPGNAGSVIHNARGRLIIFGQGTKYNEIRSSLTDTTRNYVHDLPAASGYLQTNNPTVAITKIADAWTAADWSRISGYYLPLVTGNGKAFLSDVLESKVRLYASASSNGYSQISLGNEIAQGTEKNCYGELILYGPGTKYSSLRTAQVTGNNKVYLPAYNGTAYLAHTGNNNQVGDEATPVYVAANGRLTTTGINLNNTYVKKSGDTMSGPLDAQNHIVVSTITAGNAYDQNGSAIQIREVNRVGDTQSDWTYAPKIGFHWGGTCALQLGMDSSEYLRLYSNNTQNYGKLRVGELYCQNTNGLRFCNSTPGRNFVFRNDGSNFYGLICTGSDSANDWITPSTGSHPLRINLENGNSYFSRAYGAVWNDYAEYRKDNKEEKDIQQPGRCIKENGDGTLSLTTKRLERGCEIISDTFGFAIGQDEENGYNTPIASSGRVLAYPYESIEEFASHIGYAVCSGPNGTVSIMTDEEEEKYPSRIIGTISEIPYYEEWGSGKVKVNGRIWIRIR